MKKLCKTCGETNPDNFYEDRTSICKPCKSLENSVKAKRKRKENKINNIPPKDYKAKDRAKYRGKIALAKLPYVRKIGNKIPDREFYVIDSVFENRFYITFPELNESSDNLWNDIDQWVYNEEDLIEECIKSAKNFEYEDQRYFARKKYYDKKHEKDLQDEEENEDLF